MNETINAPEPENTANAILEYCTSLALVEPEQIQQARELALTADNPELFNQLLRNYQDLLQAHIDGLGDEQRATAQIGYGLMTALIRYQRNDIPGFRADLEDASEYSSNMGYDEIFYKIQAFMPPQAIESPEI